MHVIATAGHVDHGKSTLVRALTGTDPDRLAEEKARGLTIDLGFAALELPSGRRAGVIDVPGHVRFLRNMLAGVGAVDACIFVVDATEGWKPQSEEHLRILELLGVGHAVVALTKVDIADRDLVELARLDVDAHLEGSAFADAPVVGVDSLSGTGLDDLRGALDAMLDETPTAIDIGRPRLWVDRAFTAKGAGTVVTGTLTGGRIRVDDEMVVLPGGTSVRVRDIQSHHAARTKINPGARVALNLGGISHDQITRGDVIVKPGQWHLTSVADASLTVLDGVDHEVSRRGAYLAYLGSGEFAVRVRVLGPDSLLPGDTGAVRLHLPVAVPLLPGDRFVLREAGRSETVGGGEILDVEPVMAAARARPDRSVERVIAERGRVDVDHLERITGVRVDATVGRWVLDPAERARIESGLATAVTDAAETGLDLSTLDEAERALVAGLEGVVVDAGRARTADAIDIAVDHPWLAALRAEPFQPPAPDDVPRDHVREFVRRGIVVDLDGVAFAAEAVDAAARTIASMLADQPGGVTVAEVRERLATTRKYAVPLLGHLDATGVTRRRGDMRIGGPRLPDPDPT
ncbi:MAG: selenocysteine-specific translation elongation factor [Acidimicrobiales bacterium]